MYTCLQLPCKPLPSATLRGSITHGVSVPASLRRLHYQLHFFVPQCRQGLPSASTHFATTVVVSTCSTARRLPVTSCDCCTLLVSPLGLKDEKVPSTFAVTRTILYYYLFCDFVREAKGRHVDETEESGVVTFFVHYGLVPHSPGQSANYSQLNGAPQTFPPKKNP